MGEPQIDDVPGYAFCHSEIAPSATPGFLSPRRVPTSATIFAGPLFGRAAAIFKGKDSWPPDVPHNLSLPVNRSRASAGFIALVIRQSAPCGRLSGESFHR